MAPSTRAFIAALALAGCGSATTPPPSESVAASAPAAPAAQLPAAGTYELDPPHTFVYFTAQHKIVGKVRGRFDKVTGTLTVAKDPAASAVDVTIEASSIDTQNTMRDDDLRGPDFFDAAKSPTITYRGRGIRPTNGGWAIDGSLTIRGITKVVPLRFTFGGTAPSEPGKPDRVAFHAEGGTKRAEFGMMRELADEIGTSTAIDVTIEVDTEALAAGSANR
jgi:polyisoprenoid-binding protein YceI